MAADRPAVTVVVCTRDRPAFLAESLAGVRDTMGAADTLVVVDSASADAAAVRAAAGDARVVRCDRPGASRARNAGAAVATTPVVAFTDDDCIPEPGWVDALAAAFTDADVVFATGRILGDGGEGPPVSVLLDEQPRSWRAGDPIAAMGGAGNLAVRREDFAAAGGFDELLGAGGLLHSSEDKDLFRRLLAGGREGRYVPAATVRHRQWRSRREALRVVYRYGIGQGALAVKVWRTEGEVGRRLLRAALWDGALRQAGRDLRARYEYGAVAGVVRAAGVTVGAVRGRRLPIVAGRFTR